MAFYKCAGLQKVSLTKSEYDILPSAQKNDPNKLYYISDIQSILDPNYTYAEAEDGAIVARRNNETGQVLWFFNGLTKDENDMDIPSSLNNFLPREAPKSQIIQAKAWNDSSSTTYVGWIGFVYPGTNKIKIRSWSKDFTNLISGTFWAVLDLDGSTSEGGQTSNYYNPYLYVNAHFIYYMNNEYINIINN